MSPRLVLVGPPGSGKTTVGRAVADALDLAFRDTDLDVEELAGTTVADIFFEHGEAHFRALEQEAVLRALSEHDGVLALGGGAVLDPRTREALDGAPVVFLDVGLADAVKRVGLTRDRPLLLGNPRAQLKQLLDARRPLYQSVARATVGTNDHSAAEVADAVVELVNAGFRPRMVGKISRIVSVGGSAAYDVMVGDRILPNTHAYLGPDVSRVAILHGAAVRGVANDVRVDLEEIYPNVHLIELPDGEDAKRIEVAASCWSALGRAGLTRTDAIVGVGGGAVTDLAGFVAATWLRGVRVVHVPTTLLGMVDAAVGGKTGLNTAEGKNLVGAFHNPAGVLCDLSTLGSLPRADLVSGLAEVVKCGFIADPAILELIQGDPAGAADPGSPTLRELVVRSIQVKADVVAADPKESSDIGIGREALNYGHTLAHAIERLEGYRWRHGDAVAVGLRFAAELGRLAGRLDDRTADRHRTMLELLGLPTTYRADAWADLLPAMRVDKKTRGDHLRFVVLDGLGRPGILADPDPGLLDAAYAAVSGSARP